MNRRRYLAALTASSLVASPLAGCVSSAGTPSPAVPDGVHRLLSLESVDAIPTGGLSVDVSLGEPSVTDDHPARVAVTTTNDGPRRDVSIAPGQCCLFNRNRGASEQPGLWLHRTGSSDHIDRDGDRWTRDAPQDEQRAYAMYGCLPMTYDSGDSVTNEYHVWDDYRVEGYYEPGRYRFAERVTVSQPGGDLDDEEAVIDAFDWGFEVRVQRP